MSTTLAEDSTDVIHGDPECHYKALEARVAPSVDPTSAVDVACYMTVDSVDADNEVVLPGGIDLTRFEKNPVLMLCHAYGQPGSYYPLPIGKVVWTKKRPNGVMAGVKFAQSTAMGREIKALFDEDMIRSFSIGFRSIEASVMTREEANSRPDWAKAFDRSGGRVLVHRKWQLMELSVAPLPSCEDALVERFKSRGLAVPSWLKTPTPEGKPMSTDETTAAVGGEPERPIEVQPAAAIEVKAAGEDDKDEPCSCGKADCPKCGEVEGKGKVPEDESGSDSEETSDEEVPEDEPEPEESGGFKRYDPVDVKARHYRGPGRIESIHTRGFVPHVDDDVVASKDSPIACVRCYRAYGDGHKATGHHTHAEMRHLTKRAEAFREPSKPAKPAARPKGAQPAPTKSAPVTADLGPLPPLVALSDVEVQAELLRQIQAIPEQVKEAIYRLSGGI